MHLINLIVPTKHILRSLGRFSENIAKNNFFTMIKVLMHSMLFRNNCIFRFLLMSATMTCDLCYHDFFPKN